MRIISGSKKGHKLIAPRKNIVRPMTDKNRETIFNILLHSKELSELGFNLKDSIVLDLFAGTGAFAFEAISRGAKKAILVENNQYMTDLIYKNLEKLKFSSEVDVILKDATTLFRTDIENKVDLVFLDPPYQKKLEFKSIKNILRQKILAKNTIVLVEQHIDESHFTYDELDLLRTKELGITRFNFYQVK